GPGGREPRAAAGGRPADRGPAGEGPGQAAAERGGGGRPAVPALGRQDGSAGRRVPRTAGTAGPPPGVVGEGARDHRRGDVRADQRAVLPAAVAGAAALTHVRGEESPPRTTGGLFALPAATTCSP